MARLDDKYKASNVSNQLNSIITIITILQTIQVNILKIYTS